MAAVMAAEGMSSPADHVPGAVEGVGFVVAQRRETDGFCSRGYGTDPFDDRNAMQSGGEFRP